MAVGTDSMQQDAVVENKNLYSLSTRKQYFYTLYK
jgi:hypothetical protein